MINGTSHLFSNANLRILCILCLLGICFAKPLFASSILVERPEEELLILELYINDDLRDRALLGYLPPKTDSEGALLPLGALSRRLSYAIEIDTAAGTAQGWFLKEGNSFQMDLNQKTLRIKGEEKPLPDNAAEAHYEDIYVRANYLEEWFGLDISTETSTMRLYITSKETLPYEEELNRRKQAEFRARYANRNRPDYSKAKLVPYKTFSLPNLMLQTSSSMQSTDGRITGFGGYALQANGDLFNLGTRLVASSTINEDGEHKLQAMQLTFNRQDPANKLLGPLHAGSFSFGDVSFPDVPLALSGRRGRGLSVSSSSVLSNSSVLTPELTIVDGDGPIGWDAELYRNGYFMDFVEVGDDGRYVFEDVELIRGFNLFEIRLYGPEGQIRTQNQRIVRGARMLREGETNYDFALGQPNADFIPLANNARDDSALGASAQFSHGIRKYLTLGGSFFHGKDSNSSIDEQQTIGTVSAMTSFLGFRNQLQLMQGTQGRSGYEIEALTRFKGANLSFTHSTFEGFNNDDKRIKNRTSLNINKKFHAFSTNAQLEKLSYLEDEDKMIIDTTLSTKIWGVDFTNNLKKTISDNKAQEDFSGELAAVLDLWNWRIRNNLSYDLDSRAKDRLNSYRVSGLRKIGEDQTLRLNATHTFSSDFTRLDARYTKQMDNMSLDFNVAGDTSHNYSTGITLRTALQADHHGDYSFVNPKDGNLGAVGLRAYIDANKNNKYDEGEKLLEGIKFRSNRGVIKESTDETGTIFVRGLNQTVTRFSIEENSLPSIYLKPAVDYIDTIPRSGATETIDLAFTELGEIDGFIYAFEKNKDGSKKPAQGIEIRLISSETGDEIQTTESEFDGYYIFSAIPLAPYTIKVIPQWGHKEQLVSRDVVLDAATPNMLNVDFQLPPYSSALKVKETKVETKEEAATIHKETATAEAETTQVSNILYLQMGALSNKEAALDEIERLKKDYATFLKDKSLITRAVTIKDKTYHRILHPVKTRKEGKDLCHALKEAGIKNGCLLIRM